MNFKQWLEKTLYHGTVIDNKDSIEKYGLDPEWHDGGGPFVTSAYGGNYGQRQGVFMTDKRNLDNSVTAMVFHIAQKLNKDFHAVSDNDIRNHGMLAIFYDAWDDRGNDYNTIKQHDDYGMDTSHIFGAEDKDYISDENIKPDKIVTGAALLRLLQRYEAWPRDMSWTWRDYPTDDKNRNLSQGIKKAIQISVERGSKRKNKRN